MWDFWICFLETVTTWDFWVDVLKYVVGLVGFTTLMAFWELCRTKKRLKKEVKDYIKSVEFEWKNQTEEFVLMHKVRRFEVLLRNVRALQPRTPRAYKCVEEVREKLEFLHVAIPVFREEHLPLPKLGEFPIQPPNSESETFVRQKVLEKLRTIKWLKLKKPTEQ